jgi:hypothetical protein
MKVTRHILLTLIIAILVFGCSKKSGIEGKLVDAKGEPMSGIKMIARQVQPVKGYEQFETVTGTDGYFNFPNVYPTADYTIMPWSDNWKTSVLVTIRSSTESQSVRIPGNMVVRFTANNEGVITDTKTGFQWISAAGRDVSWFAADKFAKGMRRGGYVDWRLPTRSDMRTIYDNSLKTEYKIDPIFQYNSSIAWTSESFDDKASYGFSFDNGLEDWYKREQTNCDRILLVRTPR